MAYQFKWPSAQYQWLATCTQHIAKRLRWTVNHKICWRLDNDCEKLLVAVHQSTATMAMAMAMRVNRNRNSRFDKCFKWIIAKPNRMIAIENNNFRDQSANSNSLLHQSLSTWECMSMMWLEFPYIFLLLPQNFSQQLCHACLALQQIFGI